MSRVLFSVKSNKYDFIFDLEPFRRDINNGINAKLWQKIKITMKPQAR